MKISKSFLILIIISILFYFVFSLECPPKQNATPPQPRIRRMMNPNGIRIFMDNVIIPDGTSFYMKVGKRLGDKIFEFTNLDSGTKATLVKRKNSYLELDPVEGVSEDVSNEYNIMEYPKNAWKTKKFFQNFNYQINNVDYECRSLGFQVDFEFDPLMKFATKEIQDSMIKLNVDIWFGWISGTNDDGSYIKDEYKVTFDFDLGVNANRQRQRRVEM